MKCPQSPRKPRDTTRQPVPVKLMAQIIDDWTSYGTEKTKKHQAQREEAHRDSGSARTVLSRERRRGARRSERRGPFSCGFIGSQPERGNPSQREFGRNGFANG